MKAIELWTIEQSFSNNSTEFRMIMFLTIDWISMNDKYGFNGNLEEKVSKL